MYWYLEEEILLMQECIAVFTSHAMWIGIFENHIRRAFKARTGNISGEGGGGGGGGATIYLTYEM